MAFILEVKLRNHFSQFQASLTKLSTQLQLVVAITISRYS